MTRLLSSDAVDARWPYEPASSLMMVLRSVARLSEQSFKAVALRVSSLWPQRLISDNPAVLASQTPAQQIAYVAPLRGAEASDPACRRSAALPCMRRGHRDRTLAGYRRSQKARACAK